MNSSDSDISPKNGQLIKNLTFPKILAKKKKEKKGKSREVNLTSVGVKQTLKATLNKNARSNKKTISRCDN